MGRKSNRVKIIELLEVDHELVKYKDEHTNFGMCWMHKKTGKYFTHDGLEKDSKFLLKHKINKHITSGLGFSTEYQKWYGWSHRALFGFGIGSEVKRGDCAYQPKNFKEWAEDITSFFEYTNYELNNNSTKIHITSKDSDLSMDYDVPKSFNGKGEWTAKTLEDAKQMAIDFAESVS